MHLKKLDPGLFEQSHLPWSFELNEVDISSMYMDSRDLSCRCEIKILHDEMRRSLELLRSGVDST